MNHSEIITDFLVRSRKKAGLSQIEVTKRCPLIGSQKMVSRLENAPLEFPLETLLSYVLAIGANRKEFSELILFTSSIQRNNAMDNIEMTRVQKEINAFITSLQKSVSQLNKLPVDIKPTELIEKFEFAIRDLSSRNDTPILAVMGPSDSGKSHIINKLIGEDLAPEGFQPMTAASTLFMHSDQKPSSLEDDVVIFKYESDDKKFNLDMLSGGYEEFVIAKGQPDILDEYGARDDDDNILHPETYLAVVYSDAPILKRVSLLDTPGQLIDPEYVRKEQEEREGESSVDSLDVRKAYEAMGLADAILFTSSINKFLRDGEPAFFANILRAPGNVPLNPQKPLSNITILATAAFTVKDTDSFKNTAIRASKNFNKEMTHYLYEDWKDSCEGIVLPTADDWAERMMPFLSENQDFVDAFNERFDSLIIDTTENIDLRREKRLVIMKKQLVSQLDAEIENLESKRRDNNERLKEVTAQDARFRRDVNGLLIKFNRLKQSISTLKSESVSEMSGLFDKLKDPEFLYDFIDARFDSKDDAKKGISSAIGQYIETRTKRIFTAKSKKFADELDQLLMEYAQIVPGYIPIMANSDVPENERMNFDVSAFDTRSAFIGGLSGLTAFGAMGFYVSTIASNLGAYILIGQASGVLATLGITSSASTLPWLVGATGGPVVWGVAIAAAIAYLVFRLFSDWRKSLAKSVAKAISSGPLYNKIKIEVNKYWDETGSAFDIALQTLITETDKYIDSLYEDAEKSYDPQEINDAADQLATVKAIIS
ncbi:dynamin family protein [Photobacterium damselae]|uniref:dynamin family protein n=1 Tax=Photobacterium damselae TaxID=38293 RepID=UPI0035A82014